MTEESCNVSLHTKLAAASGRMGLLLERLVSITRKFDNSSRMTHELHHDLEDLVCECSEYGLPWMQEVSGLMKQLYNRTRGP